MNYAEFKDERESLRRILREHIARQTLDQSNRGRSVRHAVQLFENMAINAPDRCEAVRFCWREAYRQTRKRDRISAEAINNMTLHWMRTTIDVLTNTRKIDGLLGKGGWE